jgi:hypothetical protein
MLSREERLAHGDRGIRGTPSDFLAPDSLFFVTERPGKEELIPHFHKFKDLDAQRCPVPFQVQWVTGALVQMKLFPLRSSERN